MTDTEPASGDPIPQTDPDADILLRLADGEQAAMGILMDRHLGPLKSMAWHMLGDEMAAEDITQETFLRAWKQAPDWQAGRAKFSTWMYRVAKNLCLDRLRKKTEIFTDEVPDTGDGRTDAEQELTHIQQEDRRKARIDEALQALPERQRLAVVLFHYQEKSQIEAAQILQINVRAFESLLARARSNLKSRLLSAKTELME